MIYKNKNIRGDVLNLVAQRLKHQNPDLHFSKLACQTCIARSNFAQGRYQNHPELGEDKVGNRLQIASKIYNIVVQGSKQSDLLIQNWNISKNNVLAGLELQKDLSASTEEKYNIQTTKNMIKQWVDYVLNSQKEQEIFKLLNNITLPLQKDSQMQSLKKRIIQSSQLRVLSKSNATLAQSQTMYSNFEKSEPKKYSQSRIALSSTVFSITTQQLNQMPINCQLNISQSPAIPPSDSYKLIQSNITIPSQKIMHRMKDCDENYENLLRFLMIQACSLQNFIQTPHT